MAKKFEDPLEKLDEFAPAPPPRTERKRDLFQDPLKGSAADVAKATGSATKAGRYVRKTISILPQQKELIDNLAEEAGVSAYEMYRWLLDQGLMAWEAGERPDVRTRVVQGEAVKQHWSSQVEE